MGASLPALLLLFAGSGAAALIYETVWFQLLQLVIGSSAVSVGVLLGTFMGGMCVGSVLLPRAIAARHHPLQVYACLEIGIGAFGLLLLLAIPLVGRVYFAWSGSGLGGLLIRGLVAAVCLLPPTILMGATLPAVSRWIETTPRRRVVARLVLRGKHCRRGLWLSCGRLLSASLLRHVRGDLRRRRPQRRRRGDRVADGRIGRRPSG